MLLHWTRWTDRQFSITGMTAHVGPLLSVKPAPAFAVLSNRQLGVWEVTSSAIPEARTFGPLTFRTLAAAQAYVAAEYLKL